MTPKDRAELTRLLTLQADEIRAYRLDSENVAQCLQAISDLNDCIEYADADIEVLRGYERADEQRELKREIEFRTGWILP